MPAGAMARFDVSLPLTGRTVLLAEAKDTSWEGGSVWPPTLLLSQYLDCEILQSELALDLPSCSVMELGAGCGGVGLAAAALGAQAVWLTDLDVGISTLRHNVNLNEMDNQVSVCALDWRDETMSVFASGALSAVSFDLIIASECIYDEDMAQPLLRTMHRACGDGSTCLLAGVIGSAALAAFNREAAVYFEDHRVLPPLRSGDDPMPPSRAVHVLQRRRRFL